MKKLEFTEDNKEIYSMLYEAMIAHPIKGIEEIIKSAIIINKLKSIGEESDDKNGQFTGYKLKTVPSILELEDDQFNFTKKVFEETHWSTSIKINSLAQTAKLLKQVEAG